MRERVMMPMEMGMVRERMPKVMMRSMMLT